MKKPGKQPASGPVSHGPKSKSRRKLLKLLGIGTGLSATPVFAGSTEEWEDSLFSTADLLNDKTELVLFRPQDLLELKMTFTGYKKSSDNKSLIKTAAPYLLLVEFHPQSLAEQAWEEAGGEEGQANLDASAKEDLNWNKKGQPQPMAMIITNPAAKTINPPAKTFISGKTRLVFDTKGKDNITLSPSVLLDWSSFQLVVNKRATCSPVFTAADINTAPYNNINIKAPQKVDVIKTEPVKTEPVKQPPANNNDPGRRITQPPATRDTLRRQVEVNRNIRAAGKDEAVQIQKNELPVAAVKQEDGLKANLAAFLNSNKPAPVGEMETAIDAPYRLFLSPNEFAAW